jgi:hypothetical protein
MSSISNISTASAVPAYQPQSPRSPKPAQSQSSGGDTVQLSKAALAALKSGDADHDGDSH